jgi:hypothetical protein
MATAAAVTAIALVGLLSFGPATRSGDDGIAFTSRSVSEQADGTVASDIDAGDFLLTAAVTVRAEPTPVPAPDAYVYTRSEQVGLELASSKDQLAANRRWTQIREAWLSVDDTHDSYLTIGQDKNLSQITACPVTTRSADPDEENAETDCLHQPAYIADAPTDREGMLEYLCRTTTGPGCQPVGSAQWRSDVFQHGSDLLLERTAPAAVRAAVALTDAETALRSEIIFDPRTYEVIGVRQSLLQTVDGVAAGTVTYASAVVQKTVVNKAGLRPDGSQRKLPCTHWICWPS